MEMDARWVAQLKQHPTGLDVKGAARREQTVPLERMNAEKNVERFPAKKWGDTEIAERGRSVLVMRARYRSAGLTPLQRGWTDAS